jgi:hypothetical protein
MLSNECNSEPSPSARVGISTVKVQPGIGKLKGAGFEAPESHHEFTQAEALGLHDQPRDRLTFGEIAP